jgi:hypothetical protein
MLDTSIPEEEKEIKSVEGRIEQEVRKNLFLDRCKSVIVLHDCKASCAVPNEDAVNR